MDVLLELYAQCLANQLGTSSSNLQHHDRVFRKPMTTYTQEFINRATHLQNADVVAFRNYVLKKGPFIDETVAPDLPKNNKKAAAVRQAGNRLYISREFPAALEKYNESICWAEGGSEHLGIGYANRSAIYYDMGEYELSLINIDLARKHSYPQRLLPKLLAREVNCKEKIANGDSKRAQRCHKLAMNVEVNPTRPFMAAGIEQKELPHFGRSMVADRDFKAGDVILQEKAMLTAISPELKYKNCNHCSIENFHSLIPCPNCVSVMYCSEECREKDLKFCHRFECGIMEKLHHLSYGSSRIFMGTRAFFYGLTLFGDDLKGMMEYCEANGRTGADPFTLDYSSYDPLEEFKAFHKAKLPTKKFLFEDSFRFYAAVYYSVFIKHPLVRSIVTTKPQKDFLLRSILDYMRIIGFLVIGPRQNFTSQLYSIASVCNHSCDPNTAAATYFGQVKFIVMRPISKGEQILISYGPLTGEQKENERRQVLQVYHFECLCDACDTVKWERKFSAAKKLPPISYRNMLKARNLYDNPSVDDATKFNILQQYAERYVYAHPRTDYVALVYLYRELLVDIFAKEVQNQLRDKADPLV